MGSYGSRWALIGDPDSVFVAKLLAFLQIVL
jgi:hypothetical protein